MIYLRLENNDEVMTIIYLRQENNNDLPEAGEARERPIW